MYTTIKNTRHITLGDDIRHTPPTCTFIKIIEAKKYAKCGFIIYKGYMEIQMVSI